jgi:hypothetical protein
VARVEEHARRSHVNLYRATLSLFQLEQKLEGTEKHLKKEKLLVCALLLSYTFFLHFSQHLDALKALRRLRIHKRTYQAFFDLAGTNDIPGLHRIIKNSKHGGWSAEKLPDKTRKALNRTLHTIEQILHEDRSKHLLCLLLNLLFQFLFLDLITENACL